MPERSTTTTLAASDRLLSQTLQADPGDGSVHGQLANLNLKDWKKAIEQFGQAAQKLPKELAFRSRRAAALGELKDNPNAIKEYVEVAVLYRRQGQFKNAIEAYRNASISSPRRTRAAFTGNSPKPSP